MYYLYILYSPSADLYYIGHTDNPDKRLIQHNTSDNDVYTAKYRPWQIAAKFIAGNTRAEAMKAERWVKKQKSRKLIEMLIRPDFIPNGALAHLQRISL